MSRRTRALDKAIWQRWFHYLREANPTAVALLTEANQRAFYAIAQEEIQATMAKKATRTAPKPAAPRRRLML